MADITDPMYKLNDGTRIPAMGFGTYKLNGSAGVEAMVNAIHNGYGLLDSAFNYENEGAAGKAVRDAGIGREQVMISSKLPGRHQQYKEALATVEESVYRAQVDHFDLYLIHWPNPQQGLYVEAWNALIEARRRRLIRSIGVCNFLPEHIDTLMRETGILPCVNQIEMHPYFPQAEQRRYNEAKVSSHRPGAPLAVPTICSKNRCFRASLLRSGDLSARSSYVGTISSKRCRCPKHRAQIGKGKSLLCSISNSMKKPRH